MLTTPQREALTMIEIGDTIAIEKTFPSGVSTTQLAQELAVEGIEHTLNLSDGHSVFLFTSPTTLVYELILDDAIYGITNSTNVLGQ